MKKLFLLLSFLLPCIASASDASEWHILELREAYIDYMRITHATEPFLAPTYIPKDKLDVVLNLDLFDKVFFLNNRINSETDSEQYRLVGWQYRMGAHVGDSLDIFYEHHSQHLLDYVPLIPNSYDAIGMRLYLYRARQ